ncbi:MAG TPA: EAL domain-containing protein [Macromonas sp.]|nr:EAL domain-containing protein [Macromonas sp.]
MNTTPPSHTGLDLLLQPLYGEGGAGPAATQELLQMRPATVQALERAMLNASPDGMLLVDERGQILMANASMATLSGYSLDELIGQSVNIFLPVHLRHTHGHMLNHYFGNPARRAMGARSGDLRLTCRDGSSLPVDIALNPCLLGEEGCVVAFVRDTSHYKRLESQMQYQASHDALTGLTNRWQFMRHLDMALTQVPRSQRYAVLLLLDLDDFKVINDGHGHAVGDMVLIETANRLRGVLRSSDVLARLGGDEFIVLMQGLEDPLHAEMVAHKLLGRLAEPYRVNGYVVYPGASVGIACAPLDADDPETLMRYADMAMYQAKEAGRNRCARYVPELGRLREERGRLHEKLKHAIKHGELELHYQPQVDVPSGVMVGVEALLRWRDAELGQVPPDRFVPVAESTGLMLPLGDWVLETACRQQAAWRSQGMDLRVSINLSVQQFRQQDLCERLTELLQVHGLPADSIELEITESEAMSDPEQARAMLVRLSALGVGLALDDFGTGHSSLSYLKLLPIDRLKIDRSFVAQIHEASGGDTLVRAILALAHTLGKQVVAEGVETSEQLHFLQGQGCEFYQGWLYAKAMPAPGIEALWRQQAAAPVAGLSPSSSSRC